MSEMNEKVVELLRKIALFPETPSFKGYNLTGFRMCIANWSEDAKKILLEAGFEVEEGI